MNYYEQTKELGKGYSWRNLYNMRKFYIFQKLQTVSAQLTWSHYIEILKFNDFNKIRLLTNGYSNITLLLTFQYTKATNIVNN